MPSFQLTCSDSDILRPWSENDRDAYVTFSSKESYRRIAQSENSVASQTSSTSLSSTSQSSAGGVAEVVGITSYFPELRCMDVACTKSARYSYHEGNQRYNEYIRITSPCYNKTSCRDVKKRLANHVVHSVKESGGRFLVREKESQRWLEATPKAIHEKVTHALRQKRGFLSPGAGPRQVPEHRNKKVSRALLSPDELADFKMLLDVQLSIFSKQGRKKSIKETSDESTITFDEDYSLIENFDVEDFDWEIDSGGKKMKWK